MFDRLPPSVRAFSQDRGGNVMMILGLSMVPLILLVGASVDYTRSVTKRAALQQATDATTLAVAQYLSQNITSSQLQANTQKFFAASVQDDSAWIASGPTISPDNTQVCMTTRDNVPTTIMRAAVGMGMAPASQVTVASTSCAKINNITYEIAMALDNSGSMGEAAGGQSKIQALITAANQMVSILDPAGQTPKATFSIVPFSSAVNVGAGYAGAAWMDGGAASSIHFQNFQMPSASKYLGIYLPASKFEMDNNISSRSYNTTWAGCVEERPLPYMVTDTPASKSVPDTLFVPYLYPDSGNNNYLSDANTAGVCTANDVYSKADNASTASSITVTNVIANTLRGDTQSKVCKYKGQSASATTMGYDINGNRFLTGPNLYCDSRPLTTLTNDTSALTTQINALYARGDTNLIGGLMWAWRTISPNGRFGGQVSSTIGNQNPQPYTNQKNVKAIILMTDGFNHWSNVGDSNGSIYSSLGFYANNRLQLNGGTSAGNYRAAMDAMTQQACSNAKNAGVQIFTVGFSIPTDPIDAAGLSLLQNCASLPTMYYSASDGNGLIAAFQSIAQSMSGLRLTN